MKLSALDGTAFDVIVCGAGSAGIAASVGSARLGASTLLVERYGFCGGASTAAAVHSLDAIRNCRDTSKRVVAGVAADLLEELRSIGGMAIADNAPETLVVHPEHFKVAGDRLLKRAGAQVLYHTVVVDTITDHNRAAGVEAALRDGRARLRARVIVDATGDGDVAFFAGVPFTLDPGLQALTHWFRIGNLRGGRNWREWEDVCRAAMQDAFRLGEIRVFGGPWVIRLAAGEITLNTTRVYGNPVDPAALTAAEMDAREQVLAIFEALRRRVPGLEESYILSGATQLHVRESRIIAGEYVLTEHDVLNQARFDDAIGLGAWPIDIHPTDGFVGVHPHKENPPAPYEIPYRCLVPLGVESLLVAGRPISTTHRAHGSTRIQGTSFATGHAAGIAAALCAAGGITPRRVGVVELRSRLLDQGAIVSLDGQSSAEVG
jgi:glycine/D-amino acid oxidase-like deaminating enzyme